jgi:hypothetical protein
MRVPAFTYIVLQLQVRVAQDEIHQRQHGLHTGQAQQILVDLRETST